MQILVFSFFLPQTYIYFTFGSFFLFLVGICFLPAFLALNICMQLLVSRLAFCMQKKNPSFWRFRHFVLSLSPDFNSRYPLGCLKKITQTQEWLEGYPQGPPSSASSA